MPSCEKIFEKYGGQYLVRRAKKALKQAGGNKNIAGKMLREYEDVNAEAFDKRQLLTEAQYKMANTGLNTLDDYAAYANRFGDLTTQVINEFNLGQEGFVSRLKQEGVYDVANNPKNEPLIRSLAEEEVEEKNVEDKDIVKAARILKDHRELMKKIAKEFGVIPDTLNKNYFGKQIHDDKMIFQNTLGEQWEAIKQASAGKMKREDYLRHAARERWINNLLPRLNLEETFFTNDENIAREELTKDFEERYQRFLSSKIWEEPIKVKSKMSNKLFGSSRSYHFNNAEDWTDYQNLHGRSGGLVNSVSGEATQFARVVAFMKHFGPNGEWTIQQFEKDMKDKGIATGKASLRADKIMDAYKYAAFQKDGSGSYTRGMISQAIMGGRAIAAFGKMFKSIAGPDIAVANHQASNILGASMLQQLKNTASYAGSLPLNYYNEFLKPLVTGEMGETARTKLVNKARGMSHLATNGHFNRFSLSLDHSLDSSGRGSINPFSSKFWKNKSASLGKSIRAAMQLTYKAGGVESHHHSLVTNNTYNLMTVLAKHSKFDKLPVGVKRMLQSHNIHNEEFEIWHRHMGTSDPTKHSIKIANTDAFHSTSDEELTDYMRNKNIIKKSHNPTEDELNHMRRDLQARASHMYLNYERLLVPTYDYMTKVAQKQILDNLSKGGAGKVLAAFFDQALMFKGYGWSMGSKVFKNTWNNLEGSIGKKSASMTVKMGALATAYIGWGALFHELYHVASGRGADISNVFSDDPKAKKWAEDDLLDPVFSVGGFYGETAANFYKHPLGTIVKGFGPGAEYSTEGMEAIKNTLYNHKKFGPDDARRIHASTLFTQASKGMLKNLTPWYAMRAWGKEMAYHNTTEAWKNPISYVYRQS